MSQSRYLCQAFVVDTIYHSAAYKHVPLVEFNQSQGVFNNTIGTMRLAQAAIDSNVETFVLISTDKAVRPTNTMGTSKRIAEMILQALSKINKETKKITTTNGMVKGNYMRDPKRELPLHIPSVSLCT
mgnify:CR=1 FL=1